MAFAPLLISGALGAMSAVQKSQADKYNSQVMQGESNLAVNQGAAQEAQVRRNSREMIGRETAAFGGAGVGYGGSSETALKTSAVNQELDALNTRYKGQITGYGYGVQSDIYRKQSDQDLESGMLLAGASALRAFKGGYGTYTPSTGG